MDAFVSAPHFLIPRIRPAFILPLQTHRLRYGRRPCRATLRASADPRTYPPTAPAFEVIDHASTDALLQSLQEASMPVPSDTIHEMVRHLGDSRGLARLGLVDTFGRIGNDAVPALTDSLRNNPNPVVRRSCGKALAKIGDPRATSDLLTVLVNDEDTVTRASAAGALAKLGPSAVEPLLNLISDEAVPNSAKGHAAWAIAYMRGGGTTADALFNAAGSASDDVRIAVVSALGAVAIGDSLPVMGGSDATGYDDDDWETEEGDIDAETRGRAVSTLRLMLDDTNPEVLAEAAIALANAGCVDEAPKIATLLNNADSELRRCAALSLMKLGDVSFVPALMLRIEDEDELEDVRRVAELAVRALTSEDEGTGCSCCGD